MNLFPDCLTLPDQQNNNDELQKILFAHSTAAALFRVCRVDRHFQLTVIIQIQIRFRDPQRNANSVRMRESEQHQKHMLMAGCWQIFPRLQGFEENVQSFISRLHLKKKKKNLAHTIHPSTQSAGLLSIHLPAYPSYVCFLYFKKKKNVLQVLWSELVLRVSSKVRS